MSNCGDVCSAQVDPYGRHVMRRRHRAYVRACEPITADEDDHTKMNAWVLKVWGSAWRPSAPGALLLGYHALVLVQC